MESETMTEMRQQRSITRAVAGAIAAPLWLALLLSGCENILETRPMGELNDQTFYQTQGDFEAATLGVYSTLLNYAWEQSGNGLYKGFYMPDDDVRCSTTAWVGGCNEDQFVWTAGNGHFAQIWNESYKGVMRANMILRNLPEAAGVSAAEKARFEGEAKFLRAYFYFFLARHFAVPGGSSIPLITDAARSLDEVYQGPSPTEQIWDLIESDLEAAVAGLPGRSRWINEQQVGRATRGAANALLGTVRIYRAQWLNQPGKYQEAISALQAVVDSDEYRLVPHYGHNFLEETQNNDESVFEIQFSEGTDINGWDPVDSGYGAASWSRDIAWGPQCWQNACEPWGGGRSYGLLHITSSLQNAFERVTVGDTEYEDPRRYHTALRDGERLYADPDDWIPMFQAAWSPTGSTPAKYVRPMLLDTYSQNRFHVNDYNNERLIRYADVLLLLAEARLLGNGDVAGAAALVNQVRARARNMVQGAPASFLADVPAGGSPEQWHRDYLQRERRVELALEGSRYDDLVRWHRAGLINIKTDVDFGYETPRTNWSELHLLKPIPTSELDRNPNLSQNPGY
jgi:starch-binding outer membrane protein, SusD/RagB family